MSISDQFGIIRITATEQTTTTTTATALSKKTKKREKKKEKKRTKTTTTAARIMLHSTMPRVKFHNQHIYIIPC